jgi:tetratricopeptide (TPR) repeat protein
MIARSLAFPLLVLVWPALSAQTIAPNTNFGANMSQSTFVSGSVQLEDGTAPPQGVVIQRICGSMTRDEAWTDVKGRFSFQVGGGQSLMADASLDSSGNDKTGRTDAQKLEGNMPVGEAQTAASLTGCDLRAQMTGYRSDVLHLDGLGHSSTTAVGTILLHRLGNVQGLTVSATTMAAPRESAKAYQQGLREAAKQHFDKARADFETAVKGYPGYAVAWLGLGLACEETKDFPSAIRAYTEALRADAKLLKPYERLTELADKNRQWPDSAKYSAEWIRLDPVEFPNAYLLNAVANIQLNKLDLAEKSAREGLRLDTEGRYPRLRYVLGFVLTARNDLIEAVPYFRDYLRMDPNGSEARVLRQQLPGIEQAAAAPHKP